jgi:hypothetical protein
VAASFVAELLDLSISEASAGERAVPSSAGDQTTFLAAVKSGEQTQGERFGLVDPRRSENLY